MGAKTWMLVYADENAVAALRGGHPLDRDATLQLAKSLFPKDKLALTGDGDLSYTCPPDDELHAGVFQTSLSWRQRSSGLTIHRNCQCHLFEAAARSTYMRCTVWSTGLHSRNGLTASWYDHSVCLQTAAFSKTSGNDCLLKSRFGPVNIPL